MNQRLAFGISLIFHPLLLPTWLFSWLLYGTSGVFSINAQVKQFLIQITFTFSFLLPITFILFIRRFGLISSLSLPERRERIFPFMLISLIYLITAYIFWSLIERIYIDKRLFIIFLGIVLSLVLLSFITIFFKISAHSLAISGILGGMFAFAQKNAEESFFVPIVLTAIFWGLVLAARLSLKAHSPKEVIWGSIAGFFINFVFVRIFI